MKNHKLSQLIQEQSGILLVEVLLAVALLGIVVASLVVGMIRGEENVQISGAYSRAVLVADEGLEAVRSIRDQNFSVLTDGAYGLTAVGNNWAFMSTPDTVDIFTRTITVATVDPDRKQVTVNVTWRQNPQRMGQVTLTTYLTNWKSSGSGAISCKDYCINLGVYSSGVCRRSIAACTSRGEVNESGGDSLCTVGVNTICCCQP